MLTRKTKPRRPYLQGQRLPRSPRKSPRRRVNPRMRLPRPLNRLSFNASGRLLSDVRRLIKLLWPPDPRTTCDHPSAVFWDTSILERPSFWTRFDRLMFRKAKLVVLRSRLVLRISPRTPSSRRLPSSTRMESSSSRFLVCLSSIPLVTSLSLTSDLVVHLFAILLFWLSISCTVLSPRPSSLCVCCEIARLPSLLP